MIDRVSLAEVENVAFRLAREHLTFDEPIPDLSTRFPGKLESCLGVPFQSFRGVIPYRSLTAKASILLYLLIKNHPFQNGNKRIAIMVLLLFLARNGRWIDIEQDEFRRFTIWIAEGKAKDKDLYLVAIESIIKKHLTVAPQLQAR
jgi:prophage maintenance system killer protein